jgi:hypothetical protein
MTRRALSISPYGKAAAAARAGVLSLPNRTDAQVIQNTFRFVRTAQDDDNDSEEARMARK